PEGNGVTGYVAATGKSYVCADAACDPHYIEGARGARSSLTVALTWAEKVIGTFNVESPQPGAFGPLDLQFAEIFCRELASALHTLDLLLLEKRQAATQSIEAINREVGLPVDEILTAATSVLERWIGPALTMAKLASYGAMLADIRLPDLSGYEVYRALRGAQPGANVILMTGFGYDATHSIVKARQDGLTHILYKPFRVDQLLTALQERKP